MLPMISSKSLQLSRVQASAVFADIATASERNFAACAASPYLRARARAGNGPNSQALMKPPTSFAPEPNPIAPRPSANDSQHFHHHYHHHYFYGSSEGSFPRVGGDLAVREEKLRSPNAAMRGDMSRAEAAVRRVTQEWVLACNTKHLDDVLELYTSDATVLRSNYPALRGAAAVREFLHGALETGFGEVEMEALRVEIVGDSPMKQGASKPWCPARLASVVRNEESIFGSASAKLEASGRLPPIAGPAT